VGANIGFSATATGTPSAGTLANVAVSGSITFTAQPALALGTAASPTTFSGVGQTIAFTYTVTNSGNVTVTGVSVADTKVSPIACAATTLAAGASTTCIGTYTTTAADVNATAITSSATARATFAGAAVTSAVVTTTVKIDVETVRRATKSAIQSFLSLRADMITSMGPDTSRLHDRLTSSLFGGGTDANTQPSGVGGPREDEARAQRPTMTPAMPGFAAAGSGVRDSLASDRYALMRETERNGAGRPAISPFAFSGAADDGAGRFAFSTSLTQMRTAAAAEQAQKEAAGSGLPDGLMGLGARGPARPTADPPPPRFDVWTQGSFSYYSQDRIDGKRQGHAGIFFAGADYVVAPGLLVGALVQMDWMNESTQTLGRNADGQGWMAGPYVSARLTRNLFFDARALWGRSNNHIDPLGAYTDSFDTNRSLASAKLTGRWEYGALSFQPSVEVIYFREQQEAYVNAIGIPIDSQRVRLGRLTFGPEIGYRLPLGNGGALEPFVGVKGIWDFAKTNETTAAGEPVGREAWHGRVEAGANLRAAWGLSLRALGAYDGIGDSRFHGWQGRATLVIPLQ
jgi:outer membrane autotransporter protein